MKEFYIKVLQTMNAKNAEPFYGPVTGFKIGNDLFSIDEEHLKIKDLPIKHQDKIILYGGHCTHGRQENRKECLCVYDTRIEPTHKFCYDCKNTLCFYCKCPVLEINHKKEWEML